MTTDPNGVLDPCEKCGAPVFGYVVERCCNGSDCGCMGRPLTPCWCDACWKKYDEDYHERTAAEPIHHE